MSRELTQDRRVAKLTTPLGKDVLALTRFEGAEAMSELFEFSIDTLSPEDNVDFDKAIGRGCHVEIASYDGKKRDFHGRLVGARWTGVVGSHYAYRLTLRPWLWMLSKRSDCRIFKDKNAPDIIKEVFEKAGFSDFSDKLSADYPVIEYCVQYRETDLAFVSRLMEEFGIFYYFEHSSDKHNLVLGDSKSSHSSIGSRPFVELTGADRRPGEHLYRWESARSFRSGKFALNDYDQMSPTAKQLAEAEASESYEKSKLEMYHYPGRYPREKTDDKKRKDYGDTLAKIRLEAEQSLDRRRHAAGDAMSLYPGALMTLEKHPAGSENKQYLVVRANHSFESEGYRSGQGSANPEIYFGNYEFQPSDRPFRAPLVTPKPLMHGPQTAKVVGKDGEEIDVDKHGRVLVQFHWDRDKKQSRRVRVAQLWSGKKWGSQFIPRIGQEVVIEFLEGDPDRPMVVGTVYNADYEHPFKLPDDKTQSGFKSESSTGGQQRAYNEFRLEDKKGKEEIHLRAEKDLNVKIRDTETREIGEAFTSHKGPASRKTVLKMGDDDLKVETGNSKNDIALEYKLKAGMRILLECGTSSIEMTPASIKIKSTIIDIDGLMTTVKGNAILTLKGGLTLIN